MDKKNIQLTPQASTDIKLLMHTVAKGWGFLFGHTMGHLTVIDRLYPVNIKPKKIDALFASIYAELKDRVCGVFYMGIAPFLTTWTKEGVIMVITEDNVDFTIDSIDKDIS